MKNKCLITINILLIFRFRVLIKNFHKNIIKLKEAKANNFNLNKNYKLTFFKIKKAILYYK